MQVNGVRFAALTSAPSASHRRVLFALRRVVGASALIGALIFCLRVTEFNLFALFEASAVSSVWSFLRGLFPPDFSPAFLRVTFFAVGQTLAIAIVSSTLSIVIGLPLGILSAATLWRRGVLNGVENLSAGMRLMSVVSRLARALLGFLRAVPDLVWALLFVVAVGLVRLPVL